MRTPHDFDHFAVFRSFDSFLFHAQICKKKYEKIFFSQTGLQPLVWSVLEENWILSTIVHFLIMSKYLCKPSSTKAKSSSPALLINILYTQIQSCIIEKPWNSEIVLISRRIIEVWDHILLGYLPTYIFFFSTFNGYLFETKQELPIATTPLIFKWMSTSGLWACETNILRQRICPWLPRRVAVSSMLDRDLKSRKSAFSGDLGVV